MAGGKHVLGKSNAQRVFGTAKVGDRGQIVIPKEARDLFGIKPGDTLLLLSDGVSQKDAPKWAKFSSTTPPGALASIILKTDAATPDDATVVVVRMERKAKPS